MYNIYIYVYIYIYETEKTVSGFTTSGTGLRHSSENHGEFLCTVVLSKTVSGAVQGAAWSLSCRVPFVNPQWTSMLVSEYLCSICVLSVCDLYPTSFWKLFAIFFATYLVSMPDKSAFLSKNSSLCFGFSATYIVRLFNCPSCHAWFAWIRLASDSSARASVYFSGFEQLTHGPWRCFVVFLLAVLGCGSLTFMERMHINVWPKSDWWGH